MMAEVGWQRNGHGKGQRDRWEGSLMLMRRSRFEVLENGSSTDGGLRTDGTRPDSTWAVPSRRAGIVA